MFYNPCFRLFFTSVVIIFLIIILSFRPMTELDDNNRKQRKEKCFSQQLSGADADIVD